MRPGWDDGGAAVVKVPKLRVSLEMRWVGTQLCAGTSSLMVERGWCGRCVCVPSLCQRGIRGLRLFADGF